MTEHIETLPNTATAEITHPSASATAALATLDVTPGMHVLDVGCGPGPHLGLIAERVGAHGLVVGVDLDAEDLAVAADLHAERITRGVVRLEQGDVYQLPFADDAFDVVWMSAVFHHLEESVAALAEMARVVMPGGLVAVLDGDSDGSFPCLPWPPEFEQTLRAAALRAEREGFGGKLLYPFHGYVGRWLPRLLGEVGLAETRVQALARTENGPLPERAEAALCRWFLDSFGGRVRDFLAPQDWERLTRSFTPGSPDYLPAQPGFFVARTTFLATGRVC